MPQKILNEDWSDYDNRKQKKEDGLFFSCEEKWERDYLIGKVRKHYPQYSETAVTAAINACCKEIAAPRPRARFVTCVMARLRA